ncbi:MAG: DUF4150 domain-containing protein [Anaerolineae bacterium]|nr:DUF4150 domain-containing protein [Anaerolineae bacterium]
MNGYLSHKRIRPKHHNSDEHLHTDVVPGTTPVRAPTSWLYRLTSYCIDPQTMQQHLFCAGESIRSQAIHTLQQGHSNQTIQRQGLFTVQRQNDNLWNTLARQSTNPAAPVLLPYPSTGDTTSHAQTSTRVNFTNQDALSQQSQISQSAGDEAGPLKGVHSNINYDEC